MPYIARWKTFTVWLVVLLSMIIALPNVLPQTVLDKIPDWLPKKQLVLGLDLEGGSRISLKMERDDVIAASLRSSVNEVANLLRSAGIAYSGLSGTGQTIELTISDPSRMAAVREALKPMADRVVGDADKQVPEFAIVPGDNGALRIELTDNGIERRLSADADAAVSVLAHRLESLGGKQPMITRRGVDRVIVQIPGLFDPEQLKSILTQAGDFSYRQIDMSMQVEDAVNGTPPQGSEVVYSADDPPIGRLLRTEPVFSSSDVVSAETSTDEATGEPVVTMVLTPEGATRIAKATQTSTGTTMAVVLDGLVVATPLIRTAVTDGRVTLAADMSPEGAEDLTVLLRSGPLPAALTVLEERSTGAGRGSESIQSILRGGLIGALLVGLFMFGFYGFFGLVANVAVILNVVMIVAVLTASGLALTLPGVAGIVLTIGMAVDSNVLIYERIREEVRHGRSVFDAVQHGFARAFSAIVDANITTLIAAIILLYLGTGSVRGFAVTLAVGIVTTLFTAFTLTRVMLMVWLRSRNPKELPTGIRTGIFDGAALRFMAIRNFVFSLTALLSLLSMLAFGSLGLNLGIDFSGGAVIELRAKEGNADVEDIRLRLSQLNLGVVTAEPFGSQQDVVVRVQSREGGENAEQTSVLLIRGELEDSYDFRRVEVVGPSISGELTRAATLGIVLSLLAIIIYIWIRFEWQFSVGAIIATLHDVLLTIGLFVITGMEFNLGSVAALLMIVGYSLNDTVVVYDRIRENLKRYPRMPLPILIDTSINQTLSRTVLTGATTILALAALSLFGGEAIQSFAFVMLFGIAVATFSSIYVAGPVLILFKLRHGTPDGNADHHPTSGQTTTKGA
ncbi:SecD/SecF fusion protein [Pararhizobium capsulatum DSM 1112]|uniref:Multifunctional fusion protein n=1 Tax=Pararhizobium capsulatum DSM 1112 TaxID=1121113 RepID=A0ABU0BPN5_9HYPH|nr:protein translocase subunit SecD [Pararhizobium capsulatum]MDQ0320209.1 SecD/SecF fusion protein [Pararhizobium capsulatum DSM 1112]